MEIGNSSVLNAKSVDCTTGGGVIVADCPNLISATDNRQVALPRTIVLCMRFLAQKNGATPVRIGLTGADTRIYSMDNYNLKWFFLNNPYDISALSTADNTVVTMAFVASKGDMRVYVNGGDRQLSTASFVWCIGGGISFLCDAAFDKNVVIGEFFNAMMFNCKLTTEELDEIVAVNQMRYSK